MLAWSRGGLTALCTAFCTAFCIVLLAQMAGAEERRITLAASPDLAASGLLKHLLPRFSLKTGVRVAVVELAQGVAADVLLGPAGAVREGRPALRAKDTLYLCRITPTDTGAGRAKYTERFVAWLLSEVGQRTIESFKPNGVQVFHAAARAAGRPDRPPPVGDVLAGERLSLAHCGRCHVIGPRNRMEGLGSTPSFGVLKTLNNWEARFRGFYLLNPHPSFTQIADVTDPFDETRPPPIVPLRLTLEDLDAILAYVATIKPAELRRSKR